MINRNDARPAYRQVTDAIEADIAAGRLEPGHAIPSITEIQKMYSVSVGTAQAAIRYLRTQGVVETVQGSGTFVRKERPWIAVTSNWWTPPIAGQPDLWTRRTRENGRVGTQDITFVGPVEPPEDVRTELGLDEGETAIIRDRILRLDGEAMQLIRSYYPHDIADGTPLTEPAKIRGGSPAVLAALDDPPVRVVEMTWARMPTGDERAVLDLSPGTPVIGMLLSAMTASGRAIEVASNVLRGDRHKLRYEHPV